MTNSPALGTGGGDFTGWVYQNDILGNRTGCNMQAYSTSSSTYTWDVLGRAETIANQTAGSAYSYRADGQRIEKVDGVTVSWTGSKRSGHYDTNYTTNGPTTRYFYDGTMGVEDDYNPSGTITTVNRYALGARGIDRIENYASSTYTYGYPLYDGHGNMRATLAKSGASYTTSNWRSYDVWGSVRSGGTSGPKQRYCANLGHVADDESGLIYMRARYMEPASGRFVSEDPAKSGWNWFGYAKGNPVSYADYDGREALPTDEAGWIKWAKARYGDYNEFKKSPPFKILAAGAAA